MRLYATWSFSPFGLSYYNLIRNPFSSVSKINGVIFSIDGLEDWVMGEANFLQMEEIQSIQILAWTAERCIRLICYF